MTASVEPDEAHSMAHTATEPGNAARASATTPATARKHVLTTGIYLSVQENATFRGMPGLAIRRAVWR